MFWRQMPENDLLNHCIADRGQCVKSGGGCAIQAEERGGGGGGAGGAGGSMKADWGRLVSSAMSIV